MNIEIEKMEKEIVSNDKAYRLVAASVLGYRTLPFPEFYDALLKIITDGRKKRKYINAYYQYLEQLEGLEEKKL